MEAGKGLSDLGAGHTVLGIAGIVHDLETLPGLAEGEHAAGIVAAADLLGDVSDGLFQIVHQRQIVQVDDGTQLVRQLEFLRRCIIGREHDVFAGNAAFFRHQQFRERRAVAAAALFLQDLQNGGSGGGFDSKVLPIAGIPGEGLTQAAGVFPDARLVVDMERGGILGGNGVQLFFCDKRCFHH